MLTAQGHAPTLTQAGDVQTLTLADPNSPAPVEAEPTAEIPADPTAEIITEAHAAHVAARIAAIWALAEQRWQEGGRPLRFLGCSYFVVDSGQMSDRRAYLTEEEASEVHQLTLQHSLYANDPRRAHERIVARLAKLKAEREQAAEPAAEADEVAAEYEAAERHWLAQDTAAEYEAAERRWLSDPGEYPPVIMPWQLN